jgi:HicB_like antitoxin of bacterial toxin-antitoxin system
VMSDQRTKEYLVVLERTERDYGAYSPDLPGCVATSRTAEEALKHMREAVAMHRSRRRPGRPVGRAPRTESYEAGPDSGRARDLAGFKPDPAG